MSETQTAPVVEEQGVETPKHKAEPPLTALDRCDRCGGQAYVKTRHPLGRHATNEADTGDLLWCRHHFMAYEPLREFVIQDETHKLDVKPVASY